MHRNDERPGPRVPPESFYCIFEFMSCKEGLSLKGVELAVYALIYSYSQGKGGCYYGSNAMTAHRAGCSERHAIDVVHGLEARGLIVNVGERKWGGRVTNMYAAALGPVAQAISRCGGGGAPEAASPVDDGTGEVISPLPLVWDQGSPEGRPPNKKEIGKPIKNDGERGFPELRREGPPGSNFEDAFAEISRSYPYMKSEKTARRLYEPLHGKGVLPCHIAKMRKEGEKLNPPKEGRRPFYPELGKFLDPNNPEGYCALAEKANAKARRRHANEIRNRTLDCPTDVMYELYSIDGCDPKAKELYGAMQADGACRGESWDRWYLYMARKHDIDAREHWLEARKPEEG